MAWQRPHAKFEPVQEINTTITMTRKVSACQAETVQFMSIEKVEDEESEGFCTTNKLLRRGKKLEDNNNLSKEDEEYINYRKLLKYEQAPVYLQHNPFIRDGYRKLLPTRLCWERINNYRKLLKCQWALPYLQHNIFNQGWVSVTPANSTVLGEICLALSSLYHTFSCHSECTYNTFLMYDLFGIALSLLAIYTSGIFFPRVIGMYVISGTAFIIYTFKWCCGDKIKFAIVVQYQKK
ncbi:Uncharacterized protein OBRU01_13164 [Operophtera brumata]|uniref:Uncharacterized protein n=1 Tax=Operophtera brumata TaxID=104452 RepID=A0A0L7L973_OPEBR|nr:Uncharacterized protein OBRU01_13164 [Operophtera brumata]